MHPAQAFHPVNDGAPWLASSVENKPGTLENERMVLETFQFPLKYGDGRKSSIM